MCDMTTARKYCEEYDQYAICANLHIRPHVVFLQQFMSDAYLVCGTTCTALFRGDVHKGQVFLIFNDAVTMTSKAEPRYFR